ncbi:MAG: hypothetical protein HY617_00900 [Candidatus Sungbacteria bacterium]|nr:hypothetical protein [Candidatus Sungbacteria bacterium]
MGTEIKLFLNWPNVFKVEHEEFQSFLLELDHDDPEDQALMIKLFGSFSELFSFEGVPYRVPASYIRARAREWASGEGYGEYGAEMYMSELMRPLRIPIAWNWSEGGDIPAEVFEQVLGKRVSGFIPVVYRGRKYLVVDLWFGEVGDDSLGYPLGSVIDDISDLVGVTLVEARFIDLTL